MKSAAAAAAAMLCAGLLGAASARAECETQIRLLGEDLEKVTLTEMQKQQMVGMLQRARRHCWIHQEAPAMELIAKARQIAGLTPPRPEFDWENVPLDSLERVPPTDGDPPR
jgi:hypothetical protein